MSSQATSDPTQAIEILRTLVGFDTTSRDSNLALIDWVRAYLAEHGVDSRLVPNEDGRKANLYATLGPPREGGVVLSGHTDVVPVDGQAWSSDPFTLTHRDGRLYGRGTCDMKGFLALALAAAPALLAADVRRPVHLALSYDEEVGCLGAPAMIQRMVAELPAPSAVVVGEPTMMRPVGGHKGIAAYYVTVTGHEAHSSLTHLGASANMAAIPLLARLHALAAELEAAGDPANGFTPAGATLTVGQLNGGTALNILARECLFGFDLRTPPGLDPVEVLAPFLAACDEADSALKARFPQAGVEVRRRSLTPPLRPEADGEAERLVRRLTGDNAAAGLVAYAAEAGQFQEAGWSTIICGPGSIEQAHQADEYVELDQMRRGAAFMSRLVEELAA